MIPDKYHALLQNLTNSEDDYQRVLALIDEIVAERSTSLMEERDLARNYLDKAASLLVVLDKEGRVTFVNESTCVVTEYPAEELLGQNWFDLMIPEDDTTALAKAFNRIVQGQLEPVRYYENQIISKSGKRRLIAWHNTYHTDAKTGEIVGTFSSGEDITVRRGIEEALHQNELRYRQMFYANNAVKLVLNPKTGEIVDANEAACTYYGYAYDTLTQMNIGQINTLTTQFYIDENQTNSGKNRTYQFRHRLASGEIRDVEVYTGPITIDGDNLQFSIILDVTEREKSKRELQVRESQFRTAVSHFPNGMMLMFDTDLNCIIARGQLNLDEFETAEELEGKHLPDILPHRIWKYAETMYADALSGKSHKHNFEHDNLAFMVQVEPLFDDDGTIIGGLHLFQDITHIRQSEQLLHDTKEQLDTILNGIVDGVAVVTPDEQLMYANDAAATIFGFTSAAEMMAAMQAGLFIRHDPLDEAGNFLEFEEQALYKALQGESPPPQRIVFKNTETGREIWTESKAKPIFDVEGAVRFAVIILNDITRAHQIEQFKLTALHEQAQIETLQKYIANTTHDISQPLSVINTAVYMLDKAFKDERVQKRTASIKAQSTRIQSILQDIRQMSQLDSVSKLDFAPTNMIRLLKQIADYSEARVVENGKHFQYQCDAKRDMVIGNAQYLERAIKQLLQNAMDYTHEQGQIALRCSEKAGNFIIEVEDTGIGIEEEHMPHIFDRFYRVDKSRTTSPTSGTGLGLAIARRIMDLHGGEIEVTSTLDKGTLFRMILPLQLSE